MEQTSSLELINVQSDSEKTGNNEDQSLSYESSVESVHPSRLPCLTVTKWQIIVLVICASGGLLLIGHGFYTASIDERSLTQPRRIIKTKDYFQNEDSPLYEQPTFYIMLEMELTPYLWELLIANSTEYDDRLSDPGYSNLSNPDVNLTWILEDYVLNANQRLWGNLTSVPGDVDPSLAGSEDPTLKGYCYSYEHFQDTLMSMFTNNANFTYKNFQVKVVDGYWLVCLLITIDIRETDFANEDTQNCHFYMDWKIIMPYFWEYLGWAIDGTFLVARDWIPDGLAYDQLKQASVDFSGVKISPAICGPFKWDKEKSTTMAQWDGSGSMISITMTEKFVNGINEISVQSTAQQNGLVNGCQIFTQTSHEVNYWESFAPYSWFMAVSNAGAVWSLVTVIFFTFSRWVSDKSTVETETVTKCDLGILPMLDRNEKKRLEIENKLGRVKNRTEVLCLTVPSLKDVKNLVNRHIGTSKKTSVFGHKYEF